MTRRAAVSYAGTVAPLLAIDPDTLADRDLFVHLDALRAECARIFAIRQSKADAGEPVVREADAVAALSDRYCEVFAYAERRMGIGRTVGHFDLGKPADRERVLADREITKEANDR